MMNNREEAVEKMRRIEILAPAGSYASFRAALSAGADAVYAGGPRFGARAYADNFTVEELVQAIGEAHLFGRKFYLTVNTLLKDHEITELYDYLAPLYENGLDAVIVQDIGVLEYVRNAFPELDIHASTQMTVTGAYGAKFLEAQGVTRVVPARELSLPEIQRINEETGLEIECFVHGALCYCYSGQCLLSSMIGGRSGNRGQCAQPCRLPYTVGTQKKYYLSPRDICTLEIIPDLAEAGIDSFKIEGRMKKPEYVAAVTAMYRKYTDLYLENGRKGYRVSPEDREALMDLYNRGGSSLGYYKMHNGREMMALERPNHAGVPAVRVLSQKGREVRGLAVTQLHPGDVLEITGGKNNYTAGSPMAKGGEISFLVQKGIRLRPGTVLNRTRNESLIRDLREKYIDSSIQREIEGDLSLTVSSPAALTVSCRENDGRTVTYCAQSDEAVQEAKNRPMDEERIRTQIRKTGNSEFRFRDLKIRADRGIFIPVQQLNTLRRTALEGLKTEILSGYKRENRSRPDDIPGEEHAGKNETAWEPRFSVLVKTAEQAMAVRDQARWRPASLTRVYLESSLAEDKENREKLLCLCRELKETGVELFLAMPYIFRITGEQRIRRMRECLEQFPADGILIRNYEEYRFLQELGFDKKIILDHNLYVFNRYARSFWKEKGVSGFTAPRELNERELQGLGISGEELVIYGFLPVMLSAQCVTKTAGRCTGKTGQTVLTDRYGSRYSVKNECRGCYNVIYNNRPLYLGMHAGEIRKLSPALLRLQFESETGERTAEMLRQAYRAFCEEGSIGDADFEYTQEHFKRGIL